MLPQRLRNSLSILFIAASAGCAAPQPLAAAPAAEEIKPAETVQVAAPRADFAVWLGEFRAEAQRRGIGAATLDAALTGVQLVPQILERDRNQSEFKLTFTDYYARIVTAENVARGRDMMRGHTALLRQVAERYGVQPRFIVGIWGIETRFGAIKGSTPVIPALVTLAYDARRPAFFRNELIAALTMVDRRYIELDRLIGSWAGAMGQPQFIPSTYLAYAQDFDGDGRRDIWASEADVFASIANYLAKHGWSDKETWGRRVRLPPGFAERSGDFSRTGRSGCSAIDRMSVELPLARWQAMGLRRAEGGDLPARELTASLVQVEGEGNPSFLVYRNYHSVLRYNCAHLYALTAALLADQIGDP